MNFFNWLSNIIRRFGISQVNTACNWVAYQEEEPSSLKKYRKF